MFKNRNPKINERTVLTALIAHEKPVLASELSKELKCGSQIVSSYLESLEKQNLVVSSRYEYKGSEPYSSSRGKTAYKAEPIASDYIKKSYHESIVFVCTIIAAVMASLTLIATILVPLLI